MIDQNDRTENGGQCQTVNRVMTVPDLTSQETIADLEALNADGWSIYACMQPIKPGRQSRKKEDVAEVRRVFLDFDENAAAAYEKVLTCGLVPEPHWVLETSPGKLQLIWNVEPMEAAELESLLDAMIQEFGADPACSDVSRVLRLPGFRNCKYPAFPLVQLKDSPFDEPVPYPRSAFKVTSRLTEQASIANSPQLEPDQLIPTGKRNDSLASLAGSMRNKGFSPAAIEAALQTVNLESCKPPLDEAEVHTIAYSIGRYEVKPTPACIIGGQRIDGAQNAPAATTNGKTVNLRRADQITMKKLRWLWQNRIPLGKITAFAGNPDQGKSLATAWCAATITTAADWPDCKNTFPPSEVLILSGEDDPEDTLVPRLAAAGADLSKVHILHSTLEWSTTDGKVSSTERELQLDVDLQRLEDVMTAQPNIRLIVIDPITDYLGSAKMIDEKDVRQKVLTPLRNFAARHSVSIVMVMHLNKKVDATACRAAPDPERFPGSEKKRSPGLQAKAPHPTSNSSFARLLG